MCACGAVFSPDKVADTQTCPECGRPPDMWTSWGADGVALLD
jgi:hypothetical protein